MIDGYEYIKDIGRLEVRMCDQRNALHLLLVHFPTGKNTTRSYRVTWKKQLGRFSQDGSLNRLRHECNEEFIELTQELMNMSLYKEDA